MVDLRRPEHGQMPHVVLDPTELTLALVQRSTRVEREPGTRRLQVKRVGSETEGRAGRQGERAGGRAGAIMVVSGGENGEEEQSCIKPSNSTDRQCRWDNSVTIMTTELPT
ncbi:hypothetical protein PoB_004498900 [Plakobranchus ocellatus]|uniref:Uncharacterized protein n=1 Tax=Plakobranchus ocellatus TaxID=259542 RepID=A0AAV4BED8_9GAST|nr:hypothetical protein PoB_004498900 [Plakobranchus ocellatus]